ncbi:MAG: cobalamin biosynthetic protein CobC [Oceanicoccus sp.]|jgi:cobalamin biosynthetic protein CobC
MNDVSDSTLLAQQSLVARLLATLPLHGGDVPAAAQRYGIAAEQWVDLSTGMNPEAYPVPPIPAAAFNDLPYWQPAFLKAASQYYQQENFLAVAGTQSAIQNLPEILNTKQQLSVLLPDVGYQEHAKQWRVNANALFHYRSDTSNHMCVDINDSIAENPQQHLVVIRPNNPTTLLIDRSQLLAWSQQLAENAYLIVDEAFIDVIAEHSFLALETLPENMIVLRSFGKFFGLAGIRLGFVFANKNLLGALSEKLGIWPVNGPAQYVASCALVDRDWHKQAKKDIEKNSATTLNLFNPLLKQFDLAEPLRHDLFLSLPMSLLSALQIYNFLAKDGVLTRVVVLSENRALLRVGCVNHLDTQALEKIELLITRLCKFEKLDGLQENLRLISAETLIE